MRQIALAAFIAILINPFSALAAEMAEESRPRVVVLDFTPVGEFPPNLLSAYSEQILLALRDSGQCEEIGKADFETMIGYERFQDVMGCNDVSCMAELAGAAGAEFLLTGTVLADKGTYTVMAKLVHTTTAKIRARVQHRVEGGLSELLDSGAIVVAKTFEKEEWFHADGPKAVAAHDAETSDTKSGVEKAADKVAEVVDEVVEAVIEKIAEEPAEEPIVLTIEEQQASKSRWVKIGGITSAVSAVLGASLIYVGLITGDEIDGLAEDYENARDYESATVLHEMIDDERTLQSMIYVAGSAALAISVISGSVALWNLSSMPEATTSVGVAPNGQEGLLFFIGGEF